MIYALVLQPLLLAFVGVQIAHAAVLDDLPFSQLCLHGTDGSPLAPADQPRHPADQHCAFCFAGAFHLLDGPPPITIAYVSSEICAELQSAQPLRLSWFSRYSVARPRGPPPGV
ncbi:hypothetical protein [Bradyrhizobium sp.]|uniref:hypothetical protein n=1 Tax=Bradyrhizobium sp. TaxID=376 RepID=UPI003C3A9912